MSEFEKLLRDVQEIESPLSGLLLKALRLASELNSEDFLSWTLSETKGYDDHRTVPPYRIVSPGYQGIFHNMSGLQVGGIPLSPQLIADQELREAVGRWPLMHSIVELEELARGSEDYIENAMDSYFVELFRQSGPHMSGMILNHVTRLLPRHKIAGVLYNIRARFLDFLLSLKREFPDLAISDEPNTLVPPELVDESFRRSLYSLEVHINNHGGNAMRDQYITGQAAAVGSGATAYDISLQQLWSQHQPSIDLDALAAELDAVVAAMRDHNPTPEERVATANVEAAIESAKAGDGPKTLAFLKSAGTWAFEVATKVGTGVAIGAARTALGL